MAGAQDRLSPGGILGTRVGSLLWVLAFFTLMFSNVIQTNCGFSYVDEAVTLLLLLAAAARCAGRGRKGRCLSAAERRSLAMLALVVALGLLGNWVHGVQTGWRPIAIDAFTCLKFPVALLAALVVFDDAAAMLPLVERGMKLFLVCALAFAAVNLVADVGMAADIRYGVRSFRFVFGHPTYLCVAAVGCAVVFAGNPGRNMRWVCAALLLAASSLRSKGLAFVAVMLFLVVTARREGRVGVAHVLLGTLAVALVGWDQFSFYYQSDGFARGELTKTAVTIANTMLPLGSGFATYGSAVTAEPGYYSPLYYLYGLSTVHGLAPGHASFLSDTFWPIVLGQFGWVGLACYAAAIALLARSLYSRALRGGGALPVLACFAYLLISSTSESAFFNPLSVYLALCLGLVVRGRKESV